MIYFIQERVSGFIKIGRADDVGLRLRGLPRCQGVRIELLTLLASMPGDRYDEGLLHDLYDNQRIYGEWFLPVHDLLRNIDALTRNPDHSRAWLTQIQPYHPSFVKPVEAAELKAWRRELGLSREQAAEKHYVTLSTYIRWEQGRSEVYHHSLVRRAMDTSLRTYRSAYPNAEGMAQTTPQMRPAAP